MDFWWRYGDGPGTSARFADRAAAQEWLGSSWSTLLAEGVDEVTLLAGDSGSATEVFGPMSLHPPG